MTQRSEPQHPGGRGAGTPVVRFLKIKLLALVLLCGLPVYGVVTYWTSGVSWLPAAIYGLMSVVAFALYGYDKKQARHSGQRTPERLLHAAELLGGWPGALLAQQVFRHKTRKFSYQWVFWLIVLLHELFWMDRLLFGGSLISRHLF
ncbi:DUF1294 domain-containing protein [Pseudomonas petrae]|uniref:DUF1294 domain-containing protein n=1 Tax=Pseudomonas petrae TaxID=2912190 RepID=A0ABS9IBE2_9PSED|nr:DUF1294 domain-containing protein [Pseudomonas petrae]MCF7532810.1 DUF1294 domain-containing protein [Pseudomonas petrae]MCF7540464.1 DUF1294 domain-containing protein [Pseudomonas petrae]MCF7544694.1 DUF1294 domain-containing protein [Pseudomonas petrae]MCF7557182.1 DUF1294 domain-containing protein [Pseudomonas petrae]